MNKIVGWVKEHPVAAGSILAGGVVLLIIVLFSGSKAAPQSVAVSAQPLSDTGQNTALQVAQLQAGIQQNAISSQAATDQAAIAAAKDTALKNSDVSMANIYATADTTKFVATLGAQVQNNQTEAAKAINAANVTGATQIAQIGASAQTQIAGLYKDIAFDTNATSLSLADIQAKVSNNAIAAQITMNANNNQTQYNIAEQTNNAQLAAILNTNEENKLINMNNNYTKWMLAGHP